MALDEHRQVDERRERLIDCRVAVSFEWHVDVHIDQNRLDTRQLAIVVREQLESCRVLTRRSSVMEFFKSRRPDKTDT